MRKNFVQKSFAFFSLVSSMFSFAQTIKVSSEGGQGALNLHVAPFFLPASSCMMVSLDFLYQAIYFRMFNVIRKRACNILINEFNNFFVLILINFRSIYSMNRGMHMLCSSILKFPSIIKIQNLTNRMHTT